MGKSLVSCFFLRHSVLRYGYLRYAGVVYNQIKKGLLLSLSVNFFKLVNVEKIGPSAKQFKKLQDPPFNHVRLNF